jgi:hypothetical protein
LNITEKCPRCRNGVTLASPSAVGASKRLLEDLGIFPGEPSAADPAFRICIRCHADETTLMLYDVGVQPAAQWPVDGEHPFTTRLFEIVDEAVETVKAKRVVA